uniref:EGF-like domain-containing protein n=1 Tax=Macrostomum lignano TaxID=282301 RepID=A0A1I8G0R0_9PLAT
LFNKYIYSCNHSALFVGLYFLTNSFAAPSQAANCSTVTCHNGGTCNNYTASPPCLCPLPYIAPYCESAADYCFTLQPDKGINELPVCLNDGNCTLTYTDPYFNCTCPPEYTGNRCNETSIDINTRIVCYNRDNGTNVDCYSWDIITDIDCYSWDIITDIDCYSWDIITDIDCYSWTSSPTSLLQLDIITTSTATAGTSAQTSTATAGHQHRHRHRLLLGHQTSTATAGTTAPTSTATTETALPTTTELDLENAADTATAQTEAVNCSTVTCYNGGTCNNFTASPPCLCPLPYIAPYCESAADYCFTLQPDKGITELPV